MATHEFECHVCGKQYGSIISNRSEPPTLRACNRCCEEYAAMETKASLDALKNACCKNKNETCIALACPCIKCEYCDGPYTNGCKVVCHSEREVGGFHAAEYARAWKAQFEAERR